ncbi:MAG: cell filamentation protein Fic [Ignavibacteriae bacterium]|nr:cell filamentation protein Fic [Ignavibacteriota bacterium]NOG99335.1 cell filamentation protein Fic [Ignavibacteriota bacterium]
MSKYTQDKNYIYYPNTNIPINKLNIRDLKTLEEEERKLLLKGYEYFHINLSEQTVFDENYFVELHQKTFSKLYSFAGKFRTVNISKGYSTFCQVKFLEQSSKKIFTKLAADNYLKDYADKPNEKFAQKLSYYMCELIALHPFFELNGRITRLYFDMIATYNGYEYIDYKDALIIEEGYNKFIRASIECLNGSGNKMYQILLNGLNKVQQL